ncbi:MAG: GDP-mannose 4,6-dehydratase [Rhodobiaceae bacterium]|nr:GDP-mannose 4,6-dehydratase [Rhodobiaceae bacterium]MCC0016989.1 GDP-mannose 4,6-dehydratase [Rhodobiaceae bacterium]MCC0041512.1 GDP-mannose 4,6-dehydratase [Rhodobiaceae bacterium]
MKRALITGISGQDGAYLAQLLLDKGYEVHGAFRRSAGASDLRLRALGIDADVRPVELELLEFSNLHRVIEKIRPDEVYNLAAQSFVGVSFEQPVFTADVDALGVLRLLEAIRMAGSDARFYQASSSEMFGKVRETPQTELTPFHPRSPYGVAKVFGHMITMNYREAYAMHASNGILFNHESPLRGREFVTRRITTGLARIACGEQDRIALGNLDARRDWGFAGDYVEAIWQILQHPQADDFVIATGTSTSVRDFLRFAASAAGFDLAFEGSGVEEKGIDRKSGRVIVEIDPALFRPAEVDDLIGDGSKARSVLGWEPKVGVEELARMMVEADMKRVREGTLSF